MDFTRLDSLIHRHLPIGGELTNMLSKAESILVKAETCEGLSVEEAAILLALPHTYDEKIFASARKVKTALYGERIVLFAPLYISNLCTNNCLYCAFRMENGHIQRKKLTQEEIADQTRYLIEHGHKRILLEAGEDLTLSPIEYVLEAINTIYTTRSGKNSIRRINVNIAATTAENYRLLHEAGLGTYQLFQETYHKPTYQIMHPSGPKADYDYHLTAMERAIAGGIEDFGIGALFGLYDYRFEVLSLIAHADYLKSTFGTGPHTVSVPRLRPASNTSALWGHLVSDDEFKRIVAILRLTLPYTGIILSTRESATMRDLLLDLGVSQMSAASVTSPGGYGHEKDYSAQFDSADHRTLDECVASIIDRGYIPSFCTGCYRKQRTGQKFMHMVEHGDIKGLCHPNALLTLAEYLEDFASPTTKALALNHWEHWLSQIADTNLQQMTRAKLADILSGERDIYV